MEQPERVTQPRARLTKEQVFRAAVALADRGGLESLTMRKLAEELGVGVMSLYYYVPRNELCVMTATSRGTVGLRSPTLERDSLLSLCCPFIELATHGGHETGTSARARAGTRGHRRHTR